jgi:hypothetical protein
MKFSYKLPLNRLFLTIIPFNLKYKAKIIKPWLHNSYQFIPNNGILTLWSSVLVFKIKSIIHQISHQNSSCQSSRGTSGCECVESYLSCSMFGLSKSRAKCRAFKGLSIEVDSYLETRSMIWPFTNAWIGWQIKTASLSQLLQPVLIHVCTVHTNELASSLR